MNNFEIKGEDPILSLYIPEFRISIPGVGILILALRIIICHFKNIDPYMLDLHLGIQEESS